MRSPLPRPVLALVAACAALAAAAAAAAPASACGASARATADGSPRAAPLVVGDSTLILAAPHLGRLGLNADARGCRQFAEGVRC